MLLVKGESITKIINDNVIMNQVENSSDNLWSFLLFTGYLKAVEKVRKEEDIYYDLCIPNREVKSLYANIIRNWFSNTITKDTYEVMIKALLGKDIKTFGKILKKFVIQSMSFFDPTERVAMADMMYV